MTGRNDPCACGSGRRFKACHLDDSSAGPIWHTGARAVIALDDTSYQADGWVPAPDGCRFLVSKRSKTWVAVVVPQAAAAALAADLEVMAARLRSQLDVDELHWMEVIARKDIPQAKRSSAAEEFAELLEKHQLFVLPQTAFPQEDHDRWAAMSEADRHKTLEPSVHPGAPDIRELVESFNSNVLTGGANEVQLSADKPADIAFVRVLTRAPALLRPGEVAEVIVDAPAATGRKGPGGRWPLNTRSVGLRRSFVGPFMFEDSSSEDLLQLADLAAFAVSRMQQNRTNREMTDFWTYYSAAFELVTHAMERARQAAPAVAGTFSDTNWVSHESDGKWSVTSLGLGI